MKRKGCADPATARLLPLAEAKRAELEKETEKDEEIAGDKDGEDGAGAETPSGAPEDE